MRIIGQAASGANDGSRWSSRRVSNDDILVIHSRQHCALAVFLAIGSPSKIKLVPANPAWRQASTGSTIPSGNDRHVALDAE